MTALIIDDEKEIRETISKILALENTSSVCAETGAKAIAKYSSGDRFDFVICDIVMPEKEGLETIMEIKKIDSSAKILAISGGGRASSTEYLLIAKKFGADNSLRKPFRKSELLDAIEEMFPSPIFDRAG